MLFACSMKIKGEEFSIMFKDFFHQCDNFYIPSFFNKKKSCHIHFLSQLRILYDEYNMKIIKMKTKAF